MNGRVVIVGLRQVAVVARSAAAEELTVLTASEVGAVYGTALRVDELVRISMGLCKQFRGACKASLHEEVCPTVGVHFDKLPGGLKLGFGQFRDLVVPALDRVVGALPRFRAHVKSAKS